MKLIDRILLGPGVLIVGIFLIFLGIQGLNDEKTSIRSGEVTGTTAKLVGLYQIIFGLIVVFAVFMNFLYFPILLKIKGDSKTNTSDILKKNKHE